MSNLRLESVNSVKRMHTIKHTHNIFQTHLFFVFFRQSNRLLSGKWVIWNRFTIYVLMEFPILFFNRLIRNLILHESWHQIEGFSFELIWIQRTKTFILTLTLKIRKNRKFLQQSSSNRKFSELDRNLTILKVSYLKHWDFTFLHWGHSMCIKIQCRNKTEKLEKLKSIEKHYFKFNIWDDPYFKLNINDFKWQPSLLSDFTEKHQTENIF